MRLPSSKELKREGKMTMGKTMPQWFRITLILIAVQLAAFILRAELGGTIGWYLIPLENVPDAATGLYAMEQGFQAIFRVELMSVVAAIELTYGEIVLFLVINLVALILVAPMKLAVLERLWISFRQGLVAPDKLPKATRWYTQPKLFGKAVVVELLLLLGGNVAGIVFTLPSSALYVLLYGGNWLGNVMEPTPLLSMLALLAVGLLILGAWLAYFLYSTLYPVAYCLAAQPSYSIGKVLKRGLASTKGARGNFVTFRLTFLLWLVISNFTYGVVDIYILPYLSFSSFLFLRAVTEQRHREEQGLSN